MNTLEAIAARASVRSFADTALSATEVDALVKAARHAPVTLGKYAEFHLSVVTSRDLISRIGAFYAEKLGGDFTYGAPALIVVSAHDDLPRAQRFTSAGCIVQNIQLAALELGLGAVFNWAAGSALADQPDFLAELGLPEGFVPLTGVLVGVPADGRIEAPGEREERTDMAVNVVA